MTMRMVPLGTNGFFPSMGRHTMSFLLLTQKEAILLDAGTGVARLLEQPIAELLEPYDCLNVILSHYHMDHVGGLSYLAGTWTRGTVRIFAPAPPFVEVDPEETLNKLLSPPLFALRLAEFPATMEVVPVTSAGLRIGDLAIELRAQNHPGGSMGVRIADTVAYVTDTVVDEATAGFVQGTRLLLHEAWLTDFEAERDEAERARHSYCSGVAQIAMRGAVGELMPVHHHPKRSHADICRLAQEMGTLSGVKVTVPQEGEIYHLG